MVKIKIIKEFETLKVGDIVESSKKSAENFVSQGYAVYVEEEPDTTKGKKRKKSSEDKKQEWLENNDKPEVHRRFVYKKMSLGMTTKEIIEQMQQTGFKKWVEFDKQYCSEMINLVRKQLDLKIDKRFYNARLLQDIYVEIDKKHIMDSREKMACFLVGVSAELPNHRDRVSVALKGDSSAGKDNLVETIFDLLPHNGNLFLTRGTQSAIEKEAVNFRRLALSEMNRRDKGANELLVETIKQLSEGGFSVLKQDANTGFKTTITINAPQKTCFYATTMTESDEELATRFLIIPVIGGAPKNRAVVHNTLDQVADVNSILQQNMESNWIADNINLLDHDLQVIVPYATLLKNDIDGKPIFDFKKERIKRDIKRLMSLTKAIAWLHQKQREIIEVKGTKIILAEPTDFITAMDIFMPFFNFTYSGLDHRIQKTLDKLRELQGKHDSQIFKYRFGAEYSGYVIRHLLQAELGIDSVDTIKSYIKKLKDKGYIEKTYYNENINPRAYLIKPIGYEQATNRVALAISLEPLVAYLQANITQEIIEKMYGKQKNLYFCSFFCVLSIFSGNLVATNLVATKSQKNILPDFDNSTWINPNEVVVSEEQVFDNPDDEIIAWVKANNRPDNWIEATKEFGDDIIDKMLTNGDLMENPNGHLKVVE